MRLINAEKVIANEKAFAEKYKGDFGEQVAIHTIEILEQAPTIEAIPIEWIWKYWDDGDKPKNYALHIRDMINEWKEEQDKKGVILHQGDINFVSEEAEKEYYESLGFGNED